MPFVRIDVGQEPSEEKLAVISRSIHQAMVDTIDVPEDDYFQVITRHGAGELLYDRSYLNVERSSQQMFIQITLKQGRTLAKKKALYAAIAERLQQSAGIRPQDVMIILTENTADNWSFGNGIAQMVP